MDFPFSESFKKQVQKYKLKYKCIDCVHFNEDEDLCSLEYPSKEHKHFYIIDYGAKHSPRFSFCKYFETN
jgi:hypothetical protein